jgi:hypothetical protein
MKKIANLIHGIAAVWLAGLSITITFLVYTKVFNGAEPMLLIIMALAFVPLILIIVISAILMLKAKKFKGVMSNSYAIGAEFAAAVIAIVACVITGELKTITLTYVMYGLSCVPVLAAIFDIVACKLFSSPEEEVTPPVNDEIYNK